MLGRKIKSRHDFMTPDQIRSLVHAKAPETISLEFKRDLPQDGKEFSRDVCAMANAQGGTILFGIAEKAGCADTIHGVSSDNIDREILRLTDILRSGIEPRLLRFEISSIAVDEQTVLEVAVQQSMFRPHQVVAGGDRRFYVRHNSGKAIMSLDEIRDSFVNSAAVLDRARVWRSQRMAALSNDAEVKLDRSNIWLAIHLCPLTAFSASATRFDPQSQYKYREYPLRTPADLGNGRPNYLGWRIVGRDHDQNIYDYVQIYRDFRIEVVMRAGDVQQKTGTKVLWAGVNETQIFEWLERFQKWASHFEYPFPALCFVSLMETSKSAIIDDYNRYETDEVTLLLEPSLIESVDFAPRTVLRATYDHLYQSYGFASSPFFDENGDWRPRRR